MTIVINADTLKTVRDYISKFRTADTKKGGYSELRAKLKASAEGLQGIFFDIAKLAEKQAGKDAALTLAWFDAMCSAGEKAEVEAYKAGKTGDSVPTIKEVLGTSWSPMKAYVRAPLKAGKVPSDFKTASEFRQSIKGKKRGTKAKDAKTDAAAKQEAAPKAEVNQAFDKLHPALAMALTLLVKECLDSYSDDQPIIAELVAELAKDVGKLTADSTAKRTAPTQDGKAAEQM